MVEVIGAPTLDDALAVLSEEVRKSEERGGENIVFCEDKLTLLAERAVLRASGGTMQTEVATFKRFLGGSGRVLTKQGSVMALLAIMTAHEGELRCFKRGAAEVVYETIAQLSASRVDAEALEKSAEETEGMLRLKLLDLKFLLEKYNEFLQERGLVDENGYLALLPGRIAAELKNKNVFFFAFPSFTRQAVEGVRAAMENAASVTGILIAGRGDAYTNEAARLFRTCAEEYGDTRVRMLKNSLAGEAAILGGGMFSPDIYTRPAVEAEHVHIFRAADETEEMNTVCALIKKHILESGLRYRDFAVLVPDEESFLTAARAFGAFGIPFFADRKRPFSEHPFSIFALAVLTAVHDGGLPDSVDAVCASAYFGNADAYRNYLLKYGGYRGAVNREIKEGDAVKDYDRAQLCACREKLRACLALFPREGKGKKYAEGVRGLYALTNGDGVTQSLSASVGNAEKEFLNISRLEEVLSEIEAIAGEEKFTAREFAALLEGGLSALKISMIPQSADAVFVGDVTESKFERVPVLFCIGLTDSVPRVCEDTAVITDGEIKKLKTLSVEIEPAVAVVNARARESLALNLSAFTEELYLGCPLRLRGIETQRGEVISCAQRIFLPAPMPELFPYNCCEPIPASLALLKYREESERGTERDMNKFPTLHAALCALGEGVRTSALFAEEKGDVARAGELYFSGTVSPTLLEAYFACPYAGFAAKGLRLQEREERPVLDTDAGTFVHNVLERAAKQFNELKGEEECRNLAEGIAREMLASPRYASLADTDAGVYTGERLVRECAEVTAVAFRQLASSSFRVRETESAFTLPDLGIRGRMDRVDEAGEYVRVIDYKTGAIDDTATSYYTGRKLQLQLYLLAAAQGGKPAGAFYFPAAESFAEEGEVKYKMRGFFSGEDEVLSLMDSVRTEGKSDFFEGGGRSDKGMPQADFEAFLEYARLVSEQAEQEMKAGNIRPSPYEGACGYCKFMGLCAFSGEPRKEDSVSCNQIARLVRKTRGEDV